MPRSGEWTPETPGALAWLGGGLQGMTKGAASSDLEMFVEVEVTKGRKIGLHFCCFLF